MVVSGRGSGRVSKAMWERELSCAASRILRSVPLDALVSVGVFGLFVTVAGSRVYGFSDAET